MGDAAELYDMLMDGDDDEQPSRCMFCGVEIHWQMDWVAQKWRPVTLKGNRHHCRGQIPGPEQDFEVIKNDA